MDGESTRNVFAPGRLSLVIPCLALSVLLVTAACGDDSEDTTQSTGTSQPGRAQTGPQPTSPAGAASGAQSLDANDFNACSLLTAGEIQTAVGAAPQGPGDSKRVGVSRSCGWTLADEGLLVANVLVYRDTAAASRGYLDIEQTYTPSTPVTGVGERASFHTATSSVSNEVNLTVLVGKATLTLNHTKRGSVAGQTQLTGLAQKALARIKQ